MCLSRLSCIFVHVLVIVGEWNANVGVHNCWTDGVGVHKWGEAGSEALWEPRADRVLFCWLHISELKQDKCVLHRNLSFGGHLQDRYVQQVCVAVYSVPVVCSCWVGNCSKYIHEIFSRVSNYHWEKTNKRSTEIWSSWAYWDKFLKYDTYAWKMLKEHSQQLLDSNNTRDEFGWIYSNSFQFFCLKSLDL